MPLPSIIMFMINSVCRSTSVELHKFFSRLSKVKVGITKQAFSFARGFLDWKVFIKLNDLFIEDYYEEDYITDKGYIVLACDGTGLELPTANEIIQDFGCASNQLGPSARPTGTSSVLYDVNNEIIINGILERYAYDEKELLLRHIEKVNQISSLGGKKIIFLLDRNYTSMELLVKMTESGIKFIVRSRRSYMQETETAGRHPKYDRVRKVFISKDMKKKKPELKKYAEETADYVNLRFVTQKFKDGETGIFITNLENHVFEREEIASLYGKRWKIETHFRHQKETCGMENFACRTTLRLRQEYYCRTVTVNFTALFAEEAQKKLDEAVKTGKIQSKYKLKINKNVAYGIVKDYLPAFILSNSADKIEEFLIKEIFRHRVCVINDRYFERTFHIRKRKHNIIYR